MKTKSKKFRPMTAFIATMIATGGFVSARAQTTPTPSPSPSATATVSPSAIAAPGAWDPFADMQRMQTEMNHFFSRATQEFGMNPNFLSMRKEPGFSSSIDVRDKGDHYEVHAFLPNFDASKVKVTAESNNLLKVEASQSKQEKNTSVLSDTFASEFGSYEQLVTLPGPARTKGMKIERKEHEVVVTIPKAKR